jgi:hypothetical protein
MLMEILRHPTDPTMYNPRKLQFEYQCQTYKATYTPWTWGTRGEPDTPAEIGDIYINKNGQWIFLDVDDCSNEYDALFNAAEEAYTSMEEEYYDLLASELKEEIPEGFQIEIPPLNDDVY